MIALSIGVGVTYPPTPRQRLQPPFFPPSPPPNRINEFFGKSTLIFDENHRDAALAYSIWFIIFLVSFSILQSHSILYRFRLVRVREGSVVSHEP